MTEPAAPIRNRHHRECPRCGGPATRVHRLPEERAAGADRAMRRYRCTSPGCGWEDTLATAPDPTRHRRLRARARERAARPRRVLAGLSVAAGLVCALAGAQAWHLYRQSESAVDRAAAGQRVIPFGQSHEGDPLAPGHPLLARASTGREFDSPALDLDSPSPPGQSGSPALALPPAPPGPSAPAQPALARPGSDPGGDAPLTLRQNCAWGDPGRDPYRGTIEQALEGARLPPEVAAQLAALIRAGKATDRLEITTASIRTVHQYREYDPRSIAMTFGKTLCVNTRVNFKPGHLERADLYEVADASGATYSVMVPYVCGNVSVLGDRAERPDGPADAPIMVLGPDGRPVLRKSSAPLPGVIAGIIGKTSVVGASGTPTTRQAQVPVPGTLANLLGGVALLGWFLRRRGRARKDE